VYIEGGNNDLLICDIDTAAAATVVESEHPYFYNESSLIPILSRTVSVPGRCPN
jgi:hypothetical protein